MTLTIELTVAIGLVCSVIGAVIAAANVRRTARKEAADEGKNDGVILTEIGYVKAGIDDIKRKQESTDGGMKAMAIELARVDASSRSMHKRLDDHLKYDHKKDVEERG